MNPPKVPRSPPGVRLSRRRFIESTAAVGAALAMPAERSAAAPHFAAAESVSATALARHIRDRDVSAVEAVRQCLARIEAVNPDLNALVTLCGDRALAEAAQADRELTAGRPVGPLHGVPFTVSDSFDTAGVVSTGGTLGRQAHVPAKDATVVARARSAGAILLGKSNVSELSLGPRSGTATNLVFGATRNPYDPRLQAAGAAGGSGAAVASGASFFDIAAGDDGAVRMPAASNGLAGLKPTLGRLPRTGHILGYGGAFDTFVELGPVARRVEDLILLTPILSGPDDADATLVPVPIRDPMQVDPASLRVAHWADEDDAPLAQIAAELRAIGARVATDAPPRVGEFDALRAEYEAGDGRAHVRRLLRKHGTSRPSPGLMTAAEAVSSPEFSRICEALDSIKSEQLAWMESYDLVICPATARAPVGWPAGIVRAGTTGQGLPAGIQLVAQPWREDVVLAAMLFVERKQGGWEMPRLRTHAK